MRSYLELIRAYPRQLSYGFLHAFFSILGQTFLFAIFVPHMRESFQIDRTQFGMIYSVATLGAASLLPFAGRLIDRVNLRAYSFVSGLILFASCWITAWAEWLPLLLLGILGLRFSGHGLLAHVESTSISRYFGNRRGVALGITSVGFSMGIALFPVAGVWLMSRFGWRTSYFILGLSLLAVFFPLSVLLARKKDDFHLPPANHPPLRAGETLAPQMGRREVLRSGYFYFVMPVLMFSPFFTSGFLFHQGSLSIYKGWNPQFVAYFLVGFAVVQSLASFGIGPAVDRLTAKALVPVHLLPMGLGIILLAVSKSAAAGAICYCLIGISLGIGRNIKSALWAEVYGTRHLGAIRGLYTSIVVVSSALSPGFFGWMLDRGMDIDGLLIAAVGLLAGAAALSYFAPEPRKAGG